MRLLAVIMLALLGACGGRGETPQSRDVPDVQALVRLDSDTLHDAVTDFSADGRSAYLTRSSADFGHTDPRTTQWSRGSWTPDEPVLPDHSGHLAGGSLAPGDTLLWMWTTAESGLGRAWNLVTSRSIEGVWQTPTVLPAPINSDASECCVTAKEPGWVYFSSNRDGSWDIYRVRTDLPYTSEPERLPSPVNGPEHEWPSWADPSGGFLLFSSIRSTGAGGDDLYITCRRGEAWEDPILLPGSTNGPEFEDSGILTPDRAHLLFSRHGAGAPGGSLGSIHMREAEPFLRLCGGA